MSPSSRSATILIAEDEGPLRKLLVSLLGSAGYGTLEAENGQQAIDLLQQQPVDLAILDVMMPYVDGFDVVRWIRQRSTLPVIILTALGNTSDIVKGFSLGADDYVTKPFTFKELQARVEALLRRSSWGQEMAEGCTLAEGDLVVDTETNQATVCGKTIQLTPIETELLAYLMARPNHAIQKADLFREVWGYDFVGSSNLVEVSIRRLREKIEPDASRPSYIQTVRGVGYRFVPQPRASGSR
ncbi:MAG: response regulator transcription factor [Chloroflexi bacterium]|nr:response regulator transcription factor [Chloroflexota bacterium]